ncbi:MAG TPA: 3-hydroxyacyl-CoA dehydrogenase [Geminicoccaceae bacterium]|nr:3-hydroxyacyl-CoA dehydrogenase [Geminicoccaceae bacterium]
MERIALVGGGLIGQAWAIVFGRAGHEVVLYDAEPAALERARGAIAARLDDLAGFGLVDDPQAVLGRIGYATGLAEALDGAAYVQESTPERVEVKREVYAELDRLAAPEAILASSTSGIPASAFTEHLAGRHRCLVAHPINPPFVTPLVELCPAPWTDAAVVERTHELMMRVGQAPIRLNKEVRGFVANRMQAALIGAALRMVEDGVASAADIDTAIKHGIGLRWSFMGPFETIDLNAPGGIADYLRRYGPLYQAIEAEHGPLAWTDDGLLGKLEQERRAALPADRLDERSAWRDRRLMALAAQKREAAKTIGE